MEGSSQKTVFKNHSVCGLAISLPTHFTIQPVSIEDNNLDFCDYTVASLENNLNGTVSSRNKARFEFSEIKELYDAALANSKLNIMERKQQQKWFVIRGIDPSSKNVIYWKRVVGENYISDMHLEYPQDDTDNPNPHLKKIATSFVSD